MIEVSIPCLGPHLPRWDRAASEPVKALNGKAAQRKNKVAWHVSCMPQSRRDWYLGTGDHGWGFAWGLSPTGRRGGLMICMGPHRHESEEMADPRRQVAEC